MEISLGLWWRTAAITVRKSAPVYVWPGYENVIVPPDAA